MTQKTQLSNTYSVEILYEDKNVIVLNKPEGLASIAENDQSLDSLHSLLEKKYAQKFFIVHRLDKEVSGVIIFAKNSDTHKIINDQFAGRTVKKTYKALISGVPRETEGIINKPIREFGSGRMGIDEKKGKQSRTKFRVIDRFKDYTLLELDPSTGRRHQLRVHLYSIGCPIAGDQRYGDKSIQSKFSRIMLHAETIEFLLPDKNKISVKAEIPETFSNILNELEK